jgi:hypothetical protein
MEVKQIFTRLPDDEGGYLKFPALMVSEGMALAIFDEHLEKHLVEATDDPCEYDLVQQSNPIFYVGNDVETVMSDISKLTVVEFTRKYEHGDFREE